MAEVGHEEDDSGQAARGQDPIDLAKGASNFESARVARFAIIGQITEPGRAFHPSTTSVTVQGTQSDRIRPVRPLSRAT